MDVEQVAAAAAVGKWETRSVFRGSFIAVFSIAECNRTLQCGGHVHPVHRLVEDEFFDLESFASRSDFLAKAFTYQLYFNLVRPNSHKQNLSPWQIVEQLQPRLPLQLCLLPPCFWIITCVTPGVTISLGFPIFAGE